MAATYESIVYDLNDFGLDTIQSAIISSDKDSGIIIEVSFDGGSTFSVFDLNEKIEVLESTNKIVVRLIFTNTPNGIYLIPVRGSYQMLLPGTSLFFQGKELYKTTIGASGSYSIELQPGKYTIWYNDHSGQKIILATEYSPEVFETTYEPVAKENTIEMFLRDIEWANYAIFDNFSGLDKMNSGTAMLSVNGDLIDKKTNQICRWWAIGLA